MHADKAAALSPLELAENSRHGPEDLLRVFAPLLHLPDDLLLRIIHCLPSTARRRLRLVSARLCAVVNATVTSIILIRKGIRTPGCVETLAKRYKGLSRLCISRTGCEHVLIHSGCHYDVLDSPLRDSHVVDLSALADDGVDAGSLPDADSGCHPLELCMKDVPFRAIPCVLSLIQACGVGWQLVVDAWGSQGDRGWYLMRKLHASGYTHRLTKLRLRLDEETHRIDMPWEEMGAFFTALTALTELHFDAAYQTPALHWIAHLGSLRKLILDPVASCQIVCDVPAACGNLLHLTHLQVAVKCGRIWNRPTWQVNSFCSLRQLRVLSISLRLGVIDKELLEAACQLTNLQSLCLLEDDGGLRSYDPCSGSELVAALGSLSLLTHLTLQRICYKDVPLAHPNLRSLCLHMQPDLYTGSRTAPLVSSQLCLLTSLKTTQRLDRLQDTDGWQHWTSLQLLHMSRGASEEIASLVVLASLPLLKDLRLGCLTMDDHHEPGPCPQIPVFPSLQSIRCYIDMLDADHLLAVCHAFHRAAHLFFEVYQLRLKWTAGASEAAFSKFGCAESLRLQGFETTPFADSILHGLASTAAVPTLTQLQFISCARGLSTASIQAATAFPQLEELAFNECNKYRRGPHSIAAVTDLAAVARVMLPAVDVQLHLSDDGPDYDDWL